MVFCPLIQFGTVPLVRLTCEYLAALPNGSNMLRVVGNEIDIRSAINRFNYSYHEDFSRVRKISATYLAALTTQNATALAEALQTALLNWGA